MAEQIKRMDIKEFREFGFLQEVNRLFFHPLGLALEVEIEDDESVKLGGVWDYRNDREGMRYGGQLDEDKAERVESLRLDKAERRQKILGYQIQPVGRVK